jgi:hypothetical protein
MDRRSLHLPWSWRHPLQLRRPCVRTAIAWAHMAAAILTKMTLHSSSCWQIRAMRFAAIVDYRHLVSYCGANHKL